MNLRELRNLDVVSELDEQFARQLVRLDGGENQLLGLAAALVSQWRERGHVRLDLGTLTSSAVAGERGADPALGTLPPAAGWIAALRASPTVGAPGDFRPLILDQDGGLYLARYWQYEQDIAHALRARIGLRGTGPGSIEPAPLLDRLFPLTEGEINWQRAAAVLALHGRLTVISGGPGTGKTSTVVGILALLLTASADRPSIALAAPTGKAAARLQESIRSQKGTLDVPPEVVEAIPEETFTLHRLLGTRPGQASCRYHEDRPLPYDVIVVDEASMVDVALMAKLLKATPEQAQVILLGDKDQLASVEAGALLGDICGGAGSSGYSTTAERLLHGSGVQVQGSGNEADAGSLRDHIVLLDRNYRFEEDSAIGALAAAIRAGDATTAEALLRTGEGGITWHADPERAALAARVNEAYGDAYQGWDASGDPARAVAMLDRLRVLCAVHRGPYGVEAVNEAARKGLRGATRQAWYHGRPVMVMRNDYQLRLFNGDTGVIMHTDEGLRAIFSAGGGTTRSLHPGRLPDHTTVYAMSIHRAQGSELDEVMVVLPDVDSPVLSRELLYTAVTRARSRVEIWARPEILRAAIERPIERAGGLRRLLWPEPAPESGFPSEAT